MVFVLITEDVQVLADGLMLFHDIDQSEQIVFTDDIITGKIVETEAEFLGLGASGFY